jgi:hypothetical protein
MSFDTLAQTSDSKTNITELQFTFRTGLYKRFSLAFDLYGSGNDNEVKKQATQSGYKISLNYSSKSGFINSFLFDKLQNYEIEEADTSTYVEYRYSLQLVKIHAFKRFSLNSRFRTEYRFIETKDDGFVDVFRFRYKWGSITPINKKIVMKGAFYSFTGAEATFNSGSSVTGYSFFDKLTINLGLGYCFTDNIRIEFDYSFAYRIKSDAISKENINTYNLSLIFNNLFSKRFAKGLF